MRSVVKSIHQTPHVNSYGVVRGADQQENIIDHYAELMSVSIGSDNFGEVHGDIQTVLT